MRGTGAFGELVVQDWQAAKLLKPLAVKPVLVTLEQSLVIKTLGQLSARAISSVCPRRSLRFSVETSANPRRSSPDKPDSPEPTY